MDELLNFKLTFYFSLFKMQLSKTQPRNKRKQIRCSLKTSSSYLEFVFKNIYIFLTGKSVARLEVFMITLAEANDITCVWCVSLLSKTNVQSLNPVNVYKNYVLFLYKTVIPLFCSCPFFYPDYINHLPHLTPFLFHLFPAVSVLSASHPKMTFILFFSFLDLLTKHTVDHHLPFSQFILLCLTFCCLPNML